MHQIEDEPCIASAKPSTNYNTFSSRVLFDLCSLDHPFPYHDTGPPLFRMAKLNIHALRPFFAKKRGMWRRPMLHSSVLIGLSRRGMFDRRFGRALSGLSCDSPTSRVFVRSQCIRDTEGFTFSSHILSVRRPPSSSSIYLPWAFIHPILKAASEAALLHR